MKIIDTRGLQCPAPIIATKKALKESVDGDTFRVLTDNLTSLNNLTRFLKDNRIEFSVEESKGAWALIIKKGKGKAETMAEGETETESETEVGIKAEAEAEAETEIQNETKVETKVEESCSGSVPHFAKGNFIIVFSSDKMGEGDEELGHLLVLNFIKAIKDLDKLPEKIVFYNNGVKLVSDGSPAAEHLKEIENMGVEILVCATCARKYNLEDKIRIGTLSNMYEIAQVMASTGHIVKP